MDKNDLLVYADWLEDQGKYTVLLRNTIEEFDCLLKIVENIEVYAFGGTDGFGSGDGTIYGDGYKFTYNCASYNEYFKDIGTDFLYDIC